MTRSGRGHRAVPHTADVIIEAWGPDLPACCEEAVATIIGLCFERRSSSVSDHLGFAVVPGPNDTMLLDLLDEVVFVIDTEEAVPVGAAVRAGSSGGLDVELTMVGRDGVEPVGPAPKAVSHSGLVVEHGDGGVRCSFLVDV